MGNLDSVQGVGTANPFVDSNEAYVPKKVRAVTLGVSKSVDMTPPEKGKRFRFNTNSISSFNITEISGFCFQFMNSKGEYPLEHKKIQDILKHFKNIDPENPNATYQRAKWSEATYRLYQDSADNEVHIISLFQKVDNEARKVLFKLCDTLQMQFYKNLPIKDLTPFMMSMNFEELISCMQAMFRDSDVNELQRKETAQKVLFSKLNSCSSDDLQALLLADEEKLTKSFMSMFKLLSWKSQLILLLHMSKEEFEKLQKSNFDINYMFNEMSPQLITNVMEKFNESYNLTRLKEIFSTLTWENKLTLLNVLSDRQFNSLNDLYINAFKGQLSSANGEEFYRVSRRIKVSHRQRLSKLVTSADLKTFRLLLIKESNKTEHYIKDIAGLVSNKYLDQLVEKLHVKKTIWWPESFFQRLVEFYADCIRSKEEKKALIYFCQSYLKLNLEIYLEILPQLESY